MQFEKIKNKYIAKGKDGTFYIKKRCGVFYSSYTSKLKVFNFPPVRLLSVAKQQCQDNYYWEK